jgi:hypothetical protein
VWGQQRECNHIPQVWGAACGKEVVVPALLMHRFPENIHTSISAWKVIRIIHLAEGKPTAPYGLPED